jgi:hypothetical protein
MRIGEKPIKSVIFLAVHYINAIVTHDNDEYSRLMNLNCRTGKIIMGWKL